MNKPDTDIKAAVEEEGEREGKIISIYTPSVILDSHQDYGGRLKFLIELLAHKNCPARRADEITKEIKNLTNYIHLINLRRIHEEEQNKLKQDETDKKHIKNETALLLSEVEVTEKDNEVETTTKRERNFNKMYYNSTKRTTEEKNRRQWWLFGALAIIDLVIVWYYFIR